MSKVHFQSMPNFRQVDEGTTTKISDGKPAMLYRSSRPDFLTEVEADKFKDLGVKTIIDFRSSREYRKANGNKVLDEAFPVFKVKIPFLLRYKPGDNIIYKRIKLNKPCDSLPGDNGRRHVLIDFFKMNYIWAIFTRAPWYVQLYSMFHLVVDVLFDTGFKHFVRLFARNVLNHDNKGLTGQYIDMINYSQASICAALKILSIPENLPAMLNCAHGKDRTGLVSALVLGCLGKPKEYIAQQYARSETELAPIKERVHKEIVGQFHMSETFTTSRKENMMDAIIYIEENYGSVPSYLESIGFGKEDQERLCKNLTS